MNKIKLSKLIQNHIHIIGLITLVFIAFISTTYYASYKKKQIEAFQKTLGNIYLKKTIVTLAENLNPRYEDITIIVNDNETFEKIIKNIDLPESEINKVLEDVSKIKHLNRVYKNQKISIKIDRKTPNKILEFSIERSKTKKMLFTRNFSLDTFFMILFSDRSLKLKEDK